MNCAEAQELVGAYFDDELDPVNSLAVEKHVAGCAACAGELEVLGALRSAMRAQAPYYAAPAELRARVRGGRRSFGAGWAPWLAAAAAVLVAAAVWLAPARGPAIEEEVVAAHVRSLQGNHLLDVPSSDRHTVKPWFAGKLDFAPEVEDLADRGFALVGGRLDYLDGRAVAALIYRRRLHTVNVFVWPGKGERAMGLETRRGFNVARWTHGGLEWWAVSDLSGAELRELGRDLGAR
ncbi:MAG TPA: zf-HC2 domain-containing protein [Candidatus Sulfopaludibacter sp.]|nr:zf-HC2 domain-containing protein [Candidatus Sulfopaludibacter sp.]